MDYIFVLLKYILVIPHLLFFFTRNFRTKADIIADLDFRMLPMTIGIKK